MMSFRSLALLVACSVTIPVFGQGTTDDADARESRLRAPTAKQGMEPLPVVIELIDDVRDLHGALLDTSDLEVETAFGTAKMPLAEVLGIRMAREASDTTTIVLHNGDMITGTVDIQNLLVQTSWGKSEVNGANLASIFFDEGLSWTSLKLLAGERWTLEKAEEIAPTPTTEASVENPATPTTTTTVDRASRPSKSVLIRP